MTAAAGFDLAMVLKAAGMAAGALTQRWPKGATDETLEQAWKRLYNEPLGPGLGAVRIKGVELEAHGRGRFVVRQPSGVSIHERGAKSALEDKVEGWLEGAFGVVDELAQTLGLPKR